MTLVVAPSGANTLDDYHSKPKAFPPMKKKLNRQAFIPEAVRKILKQVPLQRFPPAKQKRFTLLMDKNNEGQLSRAEKMEIKKLGAEADELMLANSRALALALRPELFDKRGRPIQARFRRVIAANASSKNRIKSKK
jgi:hypothetical protein